TPPSTAETPSNAGSSKYSQTMETRTTPGTMRRKQAKARGVLKWLASLPRQPSLSELRAIAKTWLLRANPAQLPPDGAWRVWLLMGGRGAGKTRTGAEWVRGLVER